jgi:hypothetical protein
MKRIIDGKSYNTETAELIAEHSASCPCNDFHYFEESLYRTKKGAWFLAGSGNAMSKYSRAIDHNSRGGGDGIEVLTPEEAMEWLESHNFVDELEEHFSDKIEEA